MSGEPAPAPVDPAAADREFWKRYHDLRRMRQAELRPDDPVHPDADEEMLMKRPSPFEIHEYGEISRDGKMLSWFTGETVDPRSPEYDTNKHLYGADAYVRPGVRRRGIARSWLPHLVERMRAHGATTAGFWVEHEPGHQFMRWLGAEARLHEIESRLRLADVDWPMLERWVAEGTERSPHTKLEIFDAPMSDEALVGFARQITVMLNTIPFEDLDHGDIVITPERIREWEERASLTGEITHSAVTREVDGTISGVTNTSWAPYRPRIIHQEFTGVLPDARGRGLGKWIKAAMLLHLRELYPEAEWVATGNAGSNAPMLKINRALGFKPYRNGTEYQITREKLEEKVR
jgi:mycothiol synthase